MRTVAWLKAELSKFPDDALCYAYEGEIRGLVIRMQLAAFPSIGIIHCSESSDETDEVGTPTEDRR